MDFIPGYGEDGKLRPTKEDLLTVAEYDELKSFVKTGEGLKLHKKLRGFHLKRIEMFSKEDRTNRANSYEGLNYNELAAALM